MWEWKATVRTNYSDFEVRINAPDQMSAFQLLESMYGKGKILANNVYLVGKVS